MRGPGQAGAATRLGAIAVIGVTWRQTLFDNAYSSGILGYNLGCQPAHSPLAAEHPTDYHTSRRFSEKKGLDRENPTCK